MPLGRRGFPGSRGTVPSTVRDDTGDRTRLLAAHGAPPRRPRQASGQWVLLGWGLPAGVQWARLPAETSGSGWPHDFGAGAHFPRWAARLGWASLTTSVASGGCTGGGGRTVDRGAPLSAPPGLRLSMQGTGGRRSTLCPGRPQTALSTLGPATATADDRVSPRPWPARRVTWVFGQLAGGRRRQGAREGLLPEVPTEAGATRPGPRALRLAERAWRSLLA